MTKAWEFDLQLKDFTPSHLKDVEGVVPGRKFKTFVYSDTGTDIVERFLPHEVSNVKEIDDPLKDTSFDGWDKKKKKKYA
tara:strand:+ start:245 stop:484 length:240 start_codon:yes stop_codon:yes gene_type:complete